MKYEFDKYGNYTKRKIIPLKQKQQKTIIRIIPFEKIYNAWTFFGKDSRFHITAIAGCFVCFGIIFNIGLALENRISNIELKSTIEKDLLNRGLWEERVQKVYGVDFDPFRHAVMN